MKSRWYCHDCDAEISSAEIDAHETEGHEVTGQLRPERLLANDPWQVGQQGGDG